MISKILEIPLIHHLKKLRSDYLEEIQTITNSMTDEQTDTRTDGDYFIYMAASDWVKIHSME